MKGQTCTKLILNLVRVMPQYHCLSLALMQLCDRAHAASWWWWAIGGPLQSNGTFLLLPIGKPMLLHGSQAMDLLGWLALDLIYQVIMITWGYDLFISYYEK